MKPCIIIKTDKSNPYPRIYIEGKRWKVSRYLYSKHHNIELKKEDVVMHICDNPGCIRISHLKLGTTALNNQDKINKNRHNNPKGENHNNSCLTENDVKEIRKLYAYMHYSKAALGKMFHVSDVAIGKIIRGETWKHI